MVVIVMTIKIIFPLKKKNIIARPEKELTFAEKLADSCSRTNMNHAD